MNEEYITTKITSHCSACPCSEDCTIRTRLSGYCISIETKSLSEHDSAIIAKSREQWEKELREVLSHYSDENCVGKMNSDECLAYGDSCTLCKFDNALKLIRIDSNRTDSTEVKDVKSDKE